MVRPAVVSMYAGAKAVVKRVYGNSNGFEVKVGMHQCLSIIFLAICDCHRSFVYCLGNSELPYHGSCLYADDLVVIAETKGVVG